MPKQQKPLTETRVRKIVKEEVAREVAKEGEKTRTELRNEFKTEIKKEIVASEGRQDKKMDTNMRIVNESFQEVHERLDSVDGKLDGIQNTIDAFIARTDTLQQEQTMHANGDAAHDGIKERVSKLEVNASA